MQGVIHGAGKVILAALVLLVPALLNGYPFLYYDTESYYLLGQSILSHLPGFAADASAEAAPAVVAGLATAAADTNDSLTYIGGRSAYYGLLMRIGASLGSFWPIAILQALIAAWLISAAVRAVRPARPNVAFWALVLGLTVGSSLPFFAAYMMPDVFAGLALLGLVILAAGHERFGLVERLALVAITTLGIVAHNTNLVLAVVTLVLLLAVALVIGVKKGLLGRGAGWAAAPVALAILANGAYLLVVSAVLGETPHSPPYLMARVLADGPGRLYLAESCAPAPRFEICKHANKPLNEPNEILWSTDPAIGVFQLADGAGRRRMIEEQQAFVLGTVLAHPVEQAQASALNSLQQLGAFTAGADLNHMFYLWKDMSLSTITPWAKPGVTHSLAYRLAFPFGAADLAQNAMLLLAFGFLVWRSTRADMVTALGRPRGERTKQETELVAALGVSLGLILLLIANAVLCGSLSGAFHRYQARIVWLAPMWAILVQARFGPQLSPAAREATLAAAP